jgi:alginate O-acetyltransferase complex protein AlgI
VIFNSIDFAVFLIVVFFCYWFVFNKTLKIQNNFLVVSSYFFYGYWDWRFLFLIFASSLIDYLVGIGLSRTNVLRNRRILLLISIFANIGVLAFFKYFNFFSESFSQAFTFLGAPITDPALLNIILPVGISFYTFQTLSYSIDVFKRDVEPTRSMGAFFAYVSFFPQLVAGPIERAKHFLPQFINKRKFDYKNSVDGMRQILWGLFKKTVIADNCAIYVNDIFANYAEYSGSTLFIGVFFFAFQIYGDFSGYSDIAIGTARLFGFNLMQNFRYPYFSRDIAEFWRRWHISLSSWFRDYVYIPLGGSRAKRATVMRNVFIIFIISGFWHGANWTFIVWGILNALYVLPLMFLHKNREHTDTVADGSNFPSIKEVLQMGLTFILTLIAWVFFRSETVLDGCLYIGNIFQESFFSEPDVYSKTLFGLIAGFMIVEWLQRKKQHALQFSNTNKTRIFRWCAYYGIVWLIFKHGAQQQEFIYFQF